MTVRFCKYTEEGQILFIGEVAETMLELQGDDALVVEDGVEAGTHYVDLTTQQIVAMGEQPTTNHVFDYVNHVWFDPRTLKELQDAKWKAIKNERFKAEMGVFEYNGMVFDGDANAQRRLAGYISISKSALATGQPFSAVYTLANNTEVELSAMDFVGIEIAKATSVRDVFAKGAQLRNLIYNSSSSELSTINW